MFNITDDIQRYVDNMKKRRSCDPLIRSVDTIDDLDREEKASLFIRIVELERSDSQVAECCMQLLFAMEVWPYDYFYVRNALDRARLPAMILNEYANTLLLRYFDVNDGLRLKDMHREKVLNYPEFIDFIKLKLFEMYSLRATQLCRLVKSNRDLITGDLQDVVSFMRESAEVVESIVSDDETDLEPSHDEYGEFKQITRFSEEHRNDKKELEYTSGYLCLETPMPYVQWSDSTTGWDDILLAEYPWMHNIIRHVKLEMNSSLWNGGGSIRLGPILISGRHGMGKTSFIRRLASLIGVPIRAVQIAGSSDNRMLEGTARGWSSSQPSILARFLKETRVANTMVMVDELDKTSESSKNGNISHTLISLMEPATSSCIFDECLLSTMDYSSLQWLGTANDTSDVNPVLLSRMHVENISGLRVEDFEQVWHSVLRNILSGKGIHADSFPSIDMTVKNRIYSEYKKNIHSITIRNMNRMLNDIVNMEIEYSIGNRKRITH